MSKPEWFIVGGDDDDDALAPVVCKTTVWSVSCSAVGRERRNARPRHIRVWVKGTRGSSRPKAQCGEFSSVLRRFPAPGVGGACAASRAAGTGRPPPPPLALHGANAHVNGSADAAAIAPHLAQPLPVSRGRETLPRDAGGLSGDLRARERRHLLHSGGHGSGRPPSVLANWLTDAPRLPRLRPRPAQPHLYLCAPGSRAD
ncbi:hypothetical protein P7K49_037997 [Saguinus oedipus]|uniref:Uncharacterized protein n=1 Tax=Saguinus oedipus TaxID=9490 RepID=A0ABQ9TDF7_SAGOE|nr:hypothetical protein P7K49_037997 [Saguinus oedipus]